MIGLVLCGFSRVLLRVSHDGRDRHRAARGRRDRRDRRDRGRAGKQVTGASLLVDGRRRARRRDARRRASRSLRRPAGRGGGRRPSGRRARRAGGAATTGSTRRRSTAPADEPFTIEFDNQDHGRRSTTSSSLGGARRTRRGAVRRRDADHGPDAGRRTPCEPLAGRRVLLLLRGPPDDDDGDADGARAQPAARRPERPVIVAQNLLRHRRARRCRAARRRPLTFENEDAGVPHNIAIYTDDYCDGGVLQGRADRPGSRRRRTRSRRSTPGDVLLPLRRPPDHERDGRPCEGGPPEGGGGAAPPARAHHRPERLAAASVRRSAARATPPTRRSSRCLALARRARRQRRAVVGVPSASSEPLPVLEGERLDGGHAVAPPTFAGDGRSS